MWGSHNVDRCALIKCCFYNDIITRCIGNISVFEFIETVTSQLISQIFRSPYCKIKGTKSMLGKYMLSW